MAERGRSRYQGIYDELAPDVGRTFFIDFKPWRSFGRKRVRAAVRRWANKNAVRAGIKIQNPHLTGQQMIVYIDRVAA